MIAHGGVLFVSVNDAGEVAGLDGDLMISYRRHEQIVEKGIGLSRWARSH